MIFLILQNKRPCFWLGRYGNNECCAIRHGMSICQLVASFLESLCVLCNLQLVDALLDVTIHEDRKVVH